MAAACWPLAALRAFQASPRLPRTNLCEATARHPAPLLLLLVPVPVLVLVLMVVVVLVVSMHHSPLPAPSSRDQRAHTPTR